MMREQIRAFRSEKAQAVVIGVLDEDGELNLTAMESLIQEADGMSVTLHRAFDMCRDPFKALEEAVSLGVDTILTSGQQQSAWEGRELLAKLKEKARGGTGRLAGGGVGAEGVGGLGPVQGGNSEA